jgi:hypothetical protein
VYFTLLYPNQQHLPVSTIQQWCPTELSMSLILWTELIVFAGVRAFYVVSLNNASDIDSLAVDNGKAIE